MEKLIKGILVDVNDGGKFKEVVFEDKLENMYELLKCNTIDIVTAKIGNSYCDIICDDEGLLKNGNVLSAMNETKDYLLAGNLLITGSNEVGETISLTDEQINDVFNNEYTVIGCNKDGDSYATSVLMIEV
jgi:hypothetical protein